MAIVDRHQRSSERKMFSLCPFWQTSTTMNNSSSSSSTKNLNHNGSRHSETVAAKRSKSVSSIARSLLPPRRRLRLDPSNKLYFPYEPGTQARSAIRLKNTSKSHVAFKFQTTAPKSCFMRPPGGILAPGESIIATERPENNEVQVDLKSKVKFKIMSLKVTAGVDYLPELDSISMDGCRMNLNANFPIFENIEKEILVKLFDEQRDQVTVERILRVVFLDIGRPSPALDKLKRQLAEAEAAFEACKKPAPDTGPRVVGEGLVIDEWKERREKYLARQQVEAVDST
ncbi:hypothetical protein GOBAR_AA32756 [Gossypium barbadense]|uniref:MSP domain-containing protein n=1 Tax=Gossypium barbadense TaxID=3634 RepID=A0A2P5WA10_GOSBA|nr:hypothetical protein GOBAR_AA32756 [Gossypium barbadense]